MPRHAAPAAGPPGPAAANTPTRCGPPPQTGGAPPPPTGSGSQLAQSRPQAVSGDDQTSYGARRSGQSDKWRLGRRAPHPPSIGGGHPVAPPRGSARTGRSSLASSDAGKTRRNPNRRPCNAPAGQEARPSHPSATRTRTMPEWDRGGRRPQFAERFPERAFRPARRLPTPTGRGGRQEPCGWTNTSHKEGLR